MRDPLAGNWWRPFLPVEKEEWEFHGIKFRETGELRVLEVGEFGVWEEELVYQSRVGRWFKHPCFVLEVVNA